MKVLILILFIASCAQQELVESKTWCDETLRPEFSNFKEIKTSRTWFRTFEVGEKVIAIAEPYNYQEIISYLIIGDEKALLFDTGMGMDSMSVLVKELTDLPVIVLNSHNHYDHIGSNHEFDTVLSIGADYAIERAKNGIPHESMKHEVADDAFCADRLPSLDRDKYYSKPFKISELIKDGHQIDLGNRIIDVILSPGHMSDAIAVLDEKKGYLWTGDTFYLGPIWLFDEMTDLRAYEKTVSKFAELAPKLNKVFPAHNIPLADPIRLKELKDIFQFIKYGNPEDKSTEAYNSEGIESVKFDFEHFSFMIRKTALEAYRKSENEF